MHNLKKSSGKSLVNISESEIEEYASLVGDMLKVLDTTRDILSRSQSVGWLSTSTKKMFLDNATTAILILAGTSTFLGLNWEGLRSQNFKDLKVTSLKTSRTKKKYPNTQKR